MYNENHFPKYLGFGKLKPETITENENEITADYYFIDQAVHRIIHKKKLNVYLFEDILNDQGRISGGKNLERATLIHFDNLDCNTDNTFQYVLEKVCSLGNIYFEYLSHKSDKGGDLSDFPAGKIIVFRLPVISEKSSKSKPINSAYNIPLRIDETEPTLNPDEIYDTSLLLVEKNGNKIVIPIQVYDYIIPLPLIYQTAKWLSVNGLISREKIFRMVIQDVVNKLQNTFLAFKGTPNDNYSSYIILYKGGESNNDEFSEFNSKTVTAFLSNSSEHIC